MTGNELRASGLHLSYGGEDVVRGVDLDVAMGRITVVVGANASGKSTLLRGLGRLLRARGGAVQLDGEDIARRPARDVATRLGILPQSPTAPDGLTVGDLVARGRHPHQRWYRQWSPADDAAVTSALAATATGHLRDRAVDSLSGGQRQRAWIAMALAQGTPVLLLDEPTTYLDLCHQVEVLDLLARLNADEGRTVVMVLHDLNQACRYADRIVAMKAGRVVAEGPPADIVTESLVAQVFGLPVRVVEDPITGTPLVLPLAPARGPRSAVLAAAGS